MEPLTRERAKELNIRWRRIENWWTGAGHFADEDHVAAVVLIELPTERILEVLAAVLSRAKKPPRSLRYFMPALEEAEHEETKGRGVAGHRGGTRSMGELLAARRQG